MYATHVEFLAARAIDPSTAQAAGLRSESPASAAAELGRESSVPGDAIRIPYANLDGSPMVGDDGIEYARYRIFQTATAPDQKPIRYLGREGAGSRTYLPPALLPTLSTGFARYLVVTEGEFKALSATAAGLPTIGIAGVSMWAAETGRRLSEDTPVDPVILDLAKTAGGVVVLADSDAPEKELVKRHMSDLAKAIRSQAGVPTLFTWIPTPKPSRGEKREKLGLDDAIAKGQLAALKSRMDWLFEAETSRAKHLSGGGFVCVGYEGETNVVWSVPRGCLVQVTPKSLASHMTLLNLVGGKAWAEARYGSAPDADGNINIDWTEMANDVVTGCLEAGAFDPTQERGQGVWREGDDLVVNGSGLWRASDRSDLPRCAPGRKYVYPSAPGSWLPKDTPVGTVEDAQRALGAILAWNWASPVDPQLVFGWACLGYYAGALDWRPHASLTGNAGTGKSTLLRFLSALLGGAGRSWTGGSSAAGVRQKLKNDAAVLLLDEAEADGKRLAAVLEVLRNASDNKELVMGTQDQGGRSFTMRAMGLVAGIVPPTLNSADSTRYISVSLEKLNEASKADELASEAASEELRDLGRRMFMRMLQAWPRFVRARDMLHAAISGSSRRRDALAPVIAAGFVALNDEDLNQEQADLLAELASADVSDAMPVGNPEPQEFFDHLLATPVDVRASLGSSRCTLAEAITESIFEALQGDKRGPYTSALGVLGMRPVAEGGVDVLLVNPKAPGLRGLLRDTKWAAADLTALLRRIDGAEYKARGPVYIGGQTVRPVAVVLPKLEKATHRATSPAEFA